MSGGVDPDVCICEYLRSSAQYIIIKPVRICYTVLNGDNHIKRTSVRTRTEPSTRNSQSSAATCALKSLLLRVCQTAQRGYPDQAATDTAVAAAVADEAAGVTAARVGAVRVAAARVAEGDAVRTDDAAAPMARVVAVETVAELGAVAAEAGTAVAGPLTV